MVTSLSKDTSTRIQYGRNIMEDPISFPNYAKMPDLAVLKNPQKIPDQDFAVHDFRKFYKFFPFHGCISGKIFMKIQSTVLCKVANNQTDRQTNVGKNITSLAEVIN